jgi:dipeptidyl aminopeptidase/acylaminoacyl peptidase
MNNQQPKIAPYGGWKSPITSDLIVAGTVGLGSASVEGKELYWIETRPVEKGRYVLVRLSPDGTRTDLVPAPFNVRTRVHEYGGASYAISEGKIFFSNFADQRLYAVDGEVRPVTSEENVRFADGVIDRARRRMICVLEDHRAGNHEPANSIAAVNLDTGEIVELAVGNDFYASPRLSPDGSSLAWLEWAHPNMPWDETELWVADIDAAGRLTRKVRIAGGKGESIFQPEWSPGGTLYFVSDRSGWWNLYRQRDGKAEPLCEMEAEFGLPLWVFGMSSYDFRSDDQIICAYIEKGFSKLGLLDTKSGTLEKIEAPYSRMDGVRATPDFAVFVAASPVEATTIVRFDFATRSFETLARSSSLEIDPAYLSIPRAIEYPTENGLTAHAFFYPPKNPDYAAPQAERPPLLVMSHGGPTAATSPTLRYGIQYWTTRGIAVLDVNYGGSTGYGRAYRQRLNGNWGIVDVDDCVNGAKSLAAKGEVDGNRLAITGGSAGGYTTLCALTFRDSFKAGASHYGVSDLIALDEDTHKFESKYTFGLVGQSRELYMARSPVHHVDKLNVPVIFFQGLEDKIVPPNQSQMMVDALRAKGVPVAYVTFEGEQHGFRQAANIKRALDGELYFYSRVFGFPLADAVEPVPIENLA